MKKIIIPIILILMLPVCLATLSEEMDSVAEYVSRYDKGEISAAQLIVYVEYAKTKMYENLEKENKKTFTEDEVKEVFEAQSDKMAYGDLEYQKIFRTDDFNIVFRAHQYYRHDREYYESRDDESSYYHIAYDIQPKEAPSSALKNELAYFISDFSKNMNKDDFNFEEYHVRFGKIKAKIHEIEDCEELMASAGMEKMETTRKESVFHLIFENKTAKNCWQDKDCEEVCEESENCWEEWEWKEVCEEQDCCEEQEVCEEVCVNETVGNETIQNCSDECHMEEVCDPECGEECHEEHVSVEKCEDTQNCYMHCVPIEMCDEYIDGEVRLEGICGEEWSDIYFSAWGQGLEHYNNMNEFHQEASCGTRIEGLIQLREALQDSVDNDFARWYFQDFLGEDPEKITNGDYGFRKVLEILTRNEEELAENIDCFEEPEWPSEFEKIDISYSDDNAIIEVWEKSIPVEGRRAKYWTTLYKYSWFPDKELAKKLMNYMISERGTLALTPEQVAEIKNDFGKREIIDRLSEKYKGSFDVKLELLEQDTSLIRKFIQVNPDVAFRISDEITEKPDISVSIDFDVLYDFMHYVQYTVEGNEIKGPYWVYIEDESPGRFFSILGAVSRMWRKGVTISPRYALFKLFFSMKDLIELMEEAKTESANYEANSGRKQVKITAEAILERDNHG